MEKPANAYVVVGATTDPNARVYHTKYQLTNVIVVGVKGVQGTDSTELGGIAVEILKIDGVIQIQENPYFVLVTKAPLFSWDEVEPQIIKMLNGVVSSDSRLRAELAEISARLSSGLPVEKLYAEMERLNRV